MGKLNTESFEKYYIEKYAFGVSMTHQIFNMLENSKLKIIHFYHKASRSFAEIGVGICIMEHILLKNLFKPMKIFTDFRRLWMNPILANL